MHIIYVFQLRDAFGVLFGLWNDDPAVLQLKDNVDWLLRSQRYNMELTVPRDDRGGFYSGYFMSIKNDPEYVSKVMLELKLFHALPLHFYLESYFEEDRFFEAYKKLNITMYHDTLW